MGQGIVRLKDAVLKRSTTTTTTTTTTTPTGPFKNRGEESRGGSDDGDDLEEGMVVEEKQTGSGGSGGGGGGAGVMKVELSRGGQKMGTLHLQAHLRMRLYSAIYKDGPPSSNRRVRIVEEEE